MTEPTWRPGTFVWRELMTPDVEQAKKFYGELFGWSFETADMGDFQYTMLKVGDRSLGGMMKMEAEAQHPPHWMSYVSVEDVDASAQAAKDGGGTVPVGPMDIPNVGRFAVVGDPDHAYLSVFRASEGDPTPPERPPVGTFCWETLTTKDVEKAKAFYGDVVGWKVAEGPGGVPCFATRDDMVVVDVQKAENMPPSWATYVVVEKLEDATAKVEQLGGKVVVPRIDIPEVGSIAFFGDPAGAHLGLFSA